MCSIYTKRKQHKANLMDLISSLFVVNCLFYKGLLTIKVFYNKTYFVIM